jgi:SHAQKYF class myb-like DNA-binding protein
MCITDLPIMNDREVISQSQEKMSETPDRDGGAAAVAAAPSENTVTPTSPTFKHGRWSPEEKLLFLHGLQLFGRGRWKKIRTFLPLRSLVQVKSHGQKVLKRADAGEDIWIPLRENPGLVHDLVAEVSSSPKFIMPKIAVQVSPSIAPRRPVPKLKLKPRPVKTENLSPADGNLHFTIGNGRRENETGPSIFRTMFGGTSNQTFSFRHVPHQVEDEGSCATTHSSSCASFDPSDCQSPARPDPQMMKQTAVLAAAALCQLSSGWEDEDQQQANLVSP